VVFLHPSTVINLGIQNIMSDRMLDPNLSVYRVADGTKPLRPLLKHHQTMITICREIENTTIIDGAWARVFAGFQRMSRFLPEVERYRQFAKKAQAVYVFGIMDSEPPPIANVHYIPLNESDQLSREWFLIAYGPDYCTGLIAEELDQADPLDGERVYQGSWSFDEELISVLQHWLSGLVDASPLGNLLDNRDYKRYMDFLGNTVHRLSNVIIAAKANENDPTIPTLMSELSAVIKEDIDPPIQKLLNWLRSQPYVAPPGLGGGFPSLPMDGSGNE
jgi:DICT domain-containing protein